MIQSSASEIVTAYLVSQNVCQRQDVDGATWPMVKGVFPIEGDKFVVANDLTAMTQGKIQRTGETVTFPRVQIQVRSKDYQAAELQARLIAFTLSPILNVEVTTNLPEIVLFNACVILQPPAYLYQEDKNRRNYFVLVVQPTVTEV